MSCTGAEYIEIQRSERAYKVMTCESLQKVTVLKKTQNGSYLD